MTEPNRRGAALGPVTVLGSRLCSGRGAEHRWFWPPPMPADKLIARIDEAARYVGRERLALSTQCGFSPVSIGANLISEDTQQRKLELVAEVAHQVW